MYIGTYIVGAIKFQYLTVLLMRFQVTITVLSPYSTVLPLYIKHATLKKSTIPQPCRCCTFHLIVCSNQI